MGENHTRCYNEIDYEFSFKMHVYNNFSYNTCIIDVKALFLNVSDKRSFTTKTKVLFENMINDIESSEEFKKFDDEMHQLYHKEFKKLLSKIMHNKYGHQYITDVINDILTEKIHES